VRAVAAGVATDVTDEIPACIEDVEKEIINGYIRLKKKYPTQPYEKLVTDSYIWVPDNFKYPRRWRNRQIGTLVSGREDSVERLIPIVREAMRKGAEPGCADKITRPGFHIMGFLGGESKIAGEIRNFLLIRDGKTEPVSPSSTAQARSIRHSLRKRSNHDLSMTRTRDAQASRGRFFYDEFLRQFSAGFAYSFVVKDAQIKFHRVDRRLPAAHYENKQNECEWNRAGEEIRIFFCKYRKTHDDTAA
jgi:signal recognition particle subunit SEC65